MRLALSFLDPAPPSLTVIGGVSGSGKSTVAARVAPFVGRAPGALHVRSDVIRKRLLGVDTLTRLPASAYAPETSIRVYEEMRRVSSEALSAGHSVICDAVYASHAERELIGLVAAEAKVPLVTVWLHAADETLLGRVRGRLADASDATEEVVRGQLQQGADAPEWTHFSAEGDADQISDRVLDLLSSKGIPAPSRHHDARE
jgi:predicted kinase